MSTTRNALTAEYLYELYSTAIRHDVVCGVLVTYMRREYLPDRTFQHIHECFVSHYRTYRRPPTYAVLAQTFASDFDAIELINTFREYDGENNPEVVVDMLETYIKGVELQSIRRSASSITSGGRTRPSASCASMPSGWQASRSRARPLSTW